MNIIKIQNEILKELYNYEIGKTAQPNMFILENNEVVGLVMSMKDRAI